MTEFTSCFIGVPLPKKYQEEFERLLASIGKLYPNWEIVYPKTPHITVYYLDKQSQFALPFIASVVQTKISILKSLFLVVSGFDYFSKNDKRNGILFLDIIYSPEFTIFNQNLMAELGRYYASDNNLPFHPHMTVARVNSLRNESSLKNYITDLEHKIDKVNWKFPITEIVLYGVVSTKQPQHQEKLITIPVK